MNHLPSASWSPARSQSNNWNPMSVEILTSMQAYKLVSVIEIFLISIYVRLAVIVSNHFTGNVLINAKFLLIRLKLLVVLIKWFERISKKWQKKSWSVMARRSSLRWSDLIVLEAKKRSDEKKENKEEIKNKPWNKANERKHHLPRKSSFSVPGKPAS